MQAFSASPREMVASLWRNRSLIRNLVYREVVGRYKGSMLGIFWSLANPIFMLAVYTFVFSVVFKARWHAGSDSKTEFALVLFAGLMIFNLFSECVSRAPSLILANVNYVKKVVFPLEILPMVSMGSALFHFVVSLGVWLAAYLILFGIPHWQILLLPIVLLPLCLFVMGELGAIFFGRLPARCWANYRTSNYGIDVPHPNLLSSLRPPEKYQALMFLNPLTPPIEMARGLLYFGQLPSLEVLMAYTLGSIVFCMLGFAWFQKTRRGFADVL